MDPKRNRVRSPEYAPELLDKMTTAKAKNPTYSSTIVLSSGNGEWLRTMLIP